MEANGKQNKFCSMTVVETVCMALAYLLGDKKRQV